MAMDKKVDYNLTVDPTMIRATYILQAHDK